MEMTFIVVVVFVIGVVTGVCALRIANRRRIIGTLREDNSDPDSGPYLFLELDPGGLEKIQKNSVVMLRVKIEDYISKGVIPNV